MIYQHRAVDIDYYKFDFTEWFLGTDTIAGASTSVGPAGLIEVRGQRLTSGLVQYIAIDAGLGTAGVVYTLACRATSSSGKRHTLYKSITVLGDPTSILPIPPELAASGVYSATLSQSGILDPVAVVNANTLIAGAPVWTRTGVGTHLATLAGAFLDGKTHPIANIVPLLVGYESKAAARRLTDDTIELIVRDYADNPVDGFGILYVDFVTYD